MTDSKNEKLGFQATWSMAVGGMVGGGIFSTLGVVISIAGGWAWLSFILAGVFAFLAGYSYTVLTNHYQEAGGADTFLRKIGAEALAGSLTWILIIGYVLTMSVYAHTFGQYLAHVLNLDYPFPQIAAVLILGSFIEVNLLGVGEAGGVEVFLVWFKLIVLVGLAGYGIFNWDTDAIFVETSGNSDLWSATLGAAAVFMAYEGFQLLSYDYDEIRSPNITFPRAVLSSIVVVTFVYVLVALGVPMLIGTQQVIQNEEVALSIAGSEMAGQIGLVIVTIAAAASTGSAINATLFATARLAHTTTRDGQLPAMLDHQNKTGIPDYAVISLGVAAAVLSVVGSLALLVEAASLAFLFTFTVVSALAFHQRTGHRILTGGGSIFGVSGIIVLIVRLVEHEPFALLFIGILVIIAGFLRPWILRNVDTIDS